MKHLSAIAAIITTVATLPQAQAQDSHFQQLFSNSHDIKSLSKWGPYSKQYAGISYIEDISSGKRIDFTTVPGLYRRSYSVPNVLFESGCHPWKVSPDMKEITYRYDLEWKDKVYVDVCYKVIDSLNVRVEMHCVNNTDANQNLLLYNLMSLHYADDFPTRKADVPDGVIVLQGCDYSSFEPGIKAHDYNLVYDGWKRGEERTSNSTGGSLLNLGGDYHHSGGPSTISWKTAVTESINSSIGEHTSSESTYGKGISGDSRKGSGARAMDTVVYDFVSETDMPNAAIVMDCKVTSGQTVEVGVSGICEGTISIGGADCAGPANDGFMLVRIGTAHIHKGHNTLTLTSINDSNMKIDALYAGCETDVQRITISSRTLKYRPKVEKCRKEVIAQYEGMDNLYAMAWQFDDSEIREFENSELDVFMRKAVHRHPPKYFSGDRKGHYTSAFLRPIFLNPHSDTTIVNLIATGNRNEIEKSIASYRLSGSSQHNTTHTNNIKYLPGSEKYSFGKQLLEATLLTNIVYPVYTQGEYIRHFTPGKNWNSLYTWDEGCISLALNEIDPVKAFETIRAYTTGSTSQSAFIHHGTPLPIQFFAFSDLCNKLCDKKIIEWMYPRLKRYYDFMTGVDSTSTTMMSSGLIRTWDYFYSSGGWDDYPPQHRLRTDTQLYPSVTPCVSTSYYIRAGKILRSYAEGLGLRHDVKQYDKDIIRFSSALQMYAWDEQCGYFGYVMHDDNGNPCGIYRNDDGSNFNQGLDGVSPLVGGCCTEEQKEILIGKLFSSQHLWTDIGISTVDQSASYYDASGYWNGSVWIPHQYFLWKSLLDCGESELAYRLAHTILDTWEKECEESHYSFEHFIISSGRGAGWHNFSGLSSPVINLFNSYYKTGHIATGFDTSILDYSFNEDFTKCSASLSFDKSSIGQRKTLIICMNPDYEYEVLANGKSIEQRTTSPGLIMIELTATKKPTTLQIVRIRDASLASA